MQLIASLPNKVAAKIWSRSKLKCIISGKWRALWNYPPLPQLAAYIVIPESLCTTNVSDNYIIHDFGNDEKRMILFGTKESLTWLRDNSHWLTDETFKMAQSIFLKIFTVHALVKECVIFCIYALLINKCKESYIAIFTKLKALQ